MAKAIIEVEPAELAPTRNGASAGRRPPRVMEIADCRSCVIIANGAAACPHGLFWRESDADLLDPKLSERMCTEDECAAIEYRPHAGESVTLKVPRSYKAIEDLRNRLLPPPAPEVAAEEGAEVAPVVDTPRSATERSLEIIAEAVLAWTWTGVEPDEVLPLPSEDMDRFKAELEPAEILWLSEAILSRGDPRAQLRMSSGNI
jgi:hypothetical protein